MNRLVRHPRTSFVAFVAAIALACAGVTALAFQPAPASAEDLEKVPAEIVVKPGESVSMTFTKPLVNGGGVLYGPSDCRHDPAISLTCMTHRIKLTERVPGYFLRISTSWLAAGREAGASAPDVDSYLYTDPATHYEYSEVGGAGSSMPETIKVVTPPQTEYDLVVLAFAGAIAEHTVVVQYVNEAAGPTPAAADIVLSPKAPPIVKTVNSPMTGFTGQPGFYALVKQSPDACRTDPSKDALCDVYRLKINRNRSPEATNFVIITLEYTAREVTPDLVVGVAGLESFKDPNLDLFLWDSADHAMERTQVGGEAGAPPERIAFVATQDEYDLVVQVANGVNTNYTLKAFMSDEIFDKPFELLDPLTGEPITTPISDGSGGFIDPTDGSVVVPPLALAPLDVDDDEQIAGIGLGTTEQFDSALSLGRSNIRNTAAAAKPPSALMLWLALLVFPMALFGGGVVVMRRRHNEAF